MAEPRTPLLWTPGVHSEPQGRPGRGEQITKEQLEGRVFHTVMQADRCRKDSQQGQPVGAEIQPVLLNQVPQKGTGALGKGPFL